MAVGGLMLAGGLGWATTQMSLSDAPVTMPFVALGLVLLAGAILRHRRGQALFDPARLREIHLQSDSPGGTNVLRVLAWVVDGFACVVIVTLLWTALKQAMPMSDASYSSWAFDHSAYGGAYRGLDYWRAARPEMLTSEAQEIFGPFLCTLVAGVYLLLPAAAGSATPMMRAFRLRWLRHADGERAGAVHGVLRALGGVLFAPLQAALVLLRFRQVADARRNLADIICRTETMRIPKNWGV
jgi:hypothetical protein